MVPKCFQTCSISIWVQKINYPPALLLCFLHSYLYFCLKTHINMISSSPLLVGKCFLLYTRYFYSLSNRPSSSLVIPPFFLYLFMFSFFYSTILNWAILAQFITGSPFCTKHHYVNLQDKMRVILHFVVMGFNMSYKILKGMGNLQRC